MEEKKLIETFETIIHNNYIRFKSEQLNIILCTNNEFKYEKSRSIYHYVVINTAFIDGEKYQVKYLPSEICFWGKNKGKRNIYFTYKELK
jgi:hypothetical protein